MPNGGPAVCNISLTNVCNAKCDFCGYAFDKGLVTQWRYIDFELFAKALDILHAKGIRYLTYSGGEPLLHPNLAEMVRLARERDMRPSVVTNGALLAKRIEGLKEAGLKTIFISIDSPSAEVHEKNRGLTGVCDKIRAANDEIRAHGMKSIASVTINKLIDDYEALLPFLADLGFETVTFSYPKKAALGTSSLVYSETSSLIDYTPADLIAAFEKIKGLKGRFGILNPKESLSEMQRHLRQENEDFPCFGGFKYFYMDWNYDVFRCDSWHERMCSVWDFAETPPIRDGCTACMSDCYRDSSVLLHFAVSIGDAITHLRRGRLGKAGGALWTRTNRRSIAALVEGTGTLKKLARTG